MNVDDLYKTYLRLISKNLQDGYASPEDFNEDINRAQVMYLDYLIGEYQQYTVGRPMSVVELGNKEKIRTSVSPLVYNITLTPNTTTGIAPYPSDFELVDAMWTLYGFSNIRFVQQTRLKSFYQSVIDPIEENPCYLVQENGIQFYPENIGQVKMSYLRTPPGIYWRYILDANGIPVYDPINSVQPVWSDFDLMQILFRAVSLAGVNLQFNTVIQYAQQIKNGGQ